MFVPLPILLENVFNTVRNSLLPHKILHMTGNIVDDRINRNQIQLLIWLSCVGMICLANAHPCTVCAVGDGEQH